MDVAKEPLSTQIKDLTTNLFHLCDQRGFNFQRIIKRAKEMYLIERKED